VNAPGAGVTEAAWMAILELADHRCAYCGVELTEQTGVHEEHVIPLVRGGWHDPSNVVPACEACNLPKGRKTPREWKPDWVPPSWIVLRYTDE
jgi:5-methylcytosine-specific restriction endonuclease McrA